MLNQKRIKNLYNLKLRIIQKLTKTQKPKIEKSVMFIAEALYPFSEKILKQQQSQSIQQNQSKNSQKSFEQRKTKQNQKAALIENQSEPITDEVKGSFKFNLNQEIIQPDESSQQNQQQNQIDYLTFQKGDKIKVQQAYQNGWWFGSTLKNSEIQGFFPSNYVQIASKPKPPPPPPSLQLPSQLNQELAYDPNSEGGLDWVQKELRNITQGPVKSDYYLGIKGYKNIKIDQKNQNILKGDHVKFDVSTGLAKVPVKDQAPAAKAVRQMGYYFDYHQWVEERNKQPGHKSRPDPKKKKIKKLNLKGMK